MADFLLDLGTPQQQEYETSHGFPVPRLAGDYAAAYRSSDIHRGMLELLDETVDSSEYVETLPVFQRSMWTNTQDIVKRQCMLLLRDTNTLESRAILVLVVACVCSTNFINVNVTNAPVTLGVLFMAPMFPLFEQSSQLSMFIAMREVFYKQRLANFFQTSAYVLGNILSQVVLAVPESFIYGAFLYWITGLEASASAFVVYELILLSLLSSCLVLCSKSEWVDSVVKRDHWRSETRDNHSSYGSIRCRQDDTLGRKTTGTSCGEILLNGHQATELAIRRCTGYCEQMSIHSETATIREALVFSAFLRQSRDIPDTSKMESVSENLEFLNLQDIADLMVRGQIFEQLKRLSIGVELAAQPSVLFLDEPTSGLDARFAKMLMEEIRRVADSGRTVICTIHLPSYEVFSLFDSLLLLKRGGETVFFGDCGALVGYFQAVPGVSPLPQDVNPATWMLE
ncbi:ABC transporter G family member 38 [Phytophthora citrophthora]|uniref:ABC transporter G family member 38 n=1 Tax=Phytophthora citrophthora TaxID=4793 RepID=A0AAD9G0X4_9STRA|nr:ABC transporter G family member 38 [Phytophthora citrophthora]